MTGQRKTKYALDGEIIKIRRGLAIYKTGASRFFFARIRDTRNNKNIVRSTKETSKIEARKAAEGLFESLYVDGVISLVPREYRFETFADELRVQARNDIELGSRRDSHIKDIEFILDQKKWGLLQAFGKLDIRDIKTKEYVGYLRKLQLSKKGLSHSTHNQIQIVFRKVMRLALISGAINDIPETVKILARKAPVARTFFRFFPLISKEQDEYKRLLDGAEMLAKQGIVVRGTLITEELRNIILFLVHSFVRPTYSELYELRFSDITFRDDGDKSQEWVLLTIRKGKTGRRLTDTMPAAATVIRRIIKSRVNANQDEYIFFNQYSNRRTAARVCMRQFNHLLEYTNLKKNVETGKTHSLYSLRHTALAMRTLLSKGKVNLLILAQNAGTSIQMLEQFYLKNLPRTDDAVRNLQSFGNE